MKTKLEIMREEYEKHHDFPYPRVYTKNRNIQIDIERDHISIYSHYLTWKSPAISKDDLIEVAGILINLATKVN